MKRRSVFAPRRLAPADAALLDLERPHTGLHVGALAIVSGRLCPERLAQRIEARMWKVANLGRAVAPVPLALARPSFEDAPGFDVRDHIHPWALPSPGGEAELLGACARALSAPLDRGRPLFEMHVFEGLDGERSAVLLKLHCAVARSCAGPALFDALLDPVADAPRDLVTLRSPRGGAGPSARLGHALSDLALRGLRDATRAFSIATDPNAARAAYTGLGAALGTLRELASDVVPELPWNAYLDWSRSLATVEMPLAGIETLALEHGCEVSEIVLSAIAGALRGYLQSRGAPPPRKPVRALLPRLTRDRDVSDDGSAEVTAVVVPIPVEIADERSRIDAVVRTLRGREAHGADLASRALLGLADRLPPVVARALARGLRPERFANVISTSIEGPHESRWLCGKRLLAVHPFAPIVDGIGLSFATCTYAERLAVGIHADTDLVPDLDKLRLELEQRLSALSRSI